jgi:hypothetical protein
MITKAIQTDLVSPSTGDGIRCRLAVEQLRFENAKRCG